MSGFKINNNGKKIWLVIVVVAFLAAALYYSWPLGYLLNPVVGRHGLASDLEASGQPYNWLFIAFDVASGLLIVFIAWWLWHVWHKFMNLTVKLILVGYGLFGALTAIDALIPLNCLADQHDCVSVTNNPTVIIHGLASIGSVLGLTVSLVGIWWLVVISRHGNRNLRWPLNIIMVSWLGFGLLTLLLILTNRSSNIAQHFFITICSLWVFLLPFILSQLHSRANAFSQTFYHDRLRT